MSDSIGSTNDLPHPALVDAAEVEARAVAVLARFTDERPGTDAWRLMGVAVANALADHADDADAIDEALVVLAAVARQLPLGSDDRQIVELNHAVALSQRFALTGDPRDLERAVAMSEDLARRVGPELHADATSNLAAEHLAAYEHLGDTDALDRAIELLEDVASRSGEPVPAQARANLASAYSSRYERDGDSDNLDRALDASQVAVDAFGEDRPDMVANLANLALARYERGGQAADIDTAVAYARAACELPALPSIEARCHNTLAEVLRVAAEVHDSAEMLDEAVLHATEAVDGTGPANTSRPSYLGSLATAHYATYLRTGDVERLDAAIAASDEVRALARPGTSAAMSGTNDAIVLRCERFEVIGDSDDLTQAIAMGLDALEDDMPFETEAALRMNLANALEHRYHLEHDAANLDAAIDHVRLAVALVPTEASAMPGRLAALGRLHATRGLGPGARAGDLDTAVTHARAAAEHPAVAAADRHVYLASLASALTDGIGLSDQPATAANIEVLDQVIELLMRAYELVPEASPHTPRIEYSLGCRHADRYERSSHLDGTDDLQRAVDLWHAALHRESLPVTVYAATRLAGVAFERDMWEDAAQAAGQATDAAAALTAVRPQGSDKERARFEVQGTGAVAALATARAGLGARAAVLHLERTAAVLRAERRGRPADAVSFDDVVSAAESIDGTVLYVAATPRGGITALVDRRGHVSLGEAPDLTVERVQDELERLRDSLADDGPDDLARWDAAVSRLLRFAGAALAPAMRDVIRAGGPVAIVPVGRTGWLPFAAVTPGSATRPLLSEVEAVTTVPNARLAVAASHVDPARRLYVIAHAGPPGRVIPAVWDEARALTDTYDEVRFWRRPPPPPPPCPLSPTQSDSRPDGSGHQLRRGAGTSAAVAPDPALRTGCTWAQVVHVACHLDIDLDYPDLSTLALDGPVPVMAVTAAGTHVVLSACDSGLTGTRLPDEALGPAAALLDHGARSVTAALWPVLDEFVPAFMADLHARIAAGTAPARALADLQRVRWEEPPLVWAAFAHNGAL